MEPTYFFCLITPLAILITFLASLIIYNSRKEEDEYEKEVKNLRQLLLSGKLNKEKFITIRNRLTHEKDLNTDSKKLLSLLSAEKIDGDTYIRLREVLEKSFRNKLANGSAFFV
jgi:superfamily II DNA or RNA helicase